MRQIVLPGEQISERPMRIEGSFVEAGKTYSEVLGLYDEGNAGIIPLEGAWEPHIGDTVVGIVSGSKSKVFIVDLAYFKRSILVLDKFERFEASAGDVIAASIKDIEGNKTIILYRPEPLQGGTILKVKPTKVPRIIGKKSTMVNQIAQATRSQIRVGVNGIVWISGGDVALAARAILRIEKEAHVPGLTERIKSMLETR